MEHCAGSTALGALCCRHCAGSTVLGVLCWYLGSTVLAASLGLTYTPTSKDQLDNWLTASGEEGVCFAMSPPFIHHLYSLSTPLSPCQTHQPLPRLRRPRCTSYRIGKVTVFLVCFLRARSGFVLIVLGAECLS